MLVSSSPPGLGRIPACVTFDVSHFSQVTKRLKVVKSLPHFHCSRSQSQIISDSLLPKCQMLIQSAAIGMHVVLCSEWMRPKNFFGALSATKIRRQLLFDLLLTCTITFGFESGMICMSVFKDISSKFHAGTTLGLRSGRNIAHFPRCRESF